MFRPQLYLRNLNRAYSLSSKNYAAEAVAAAATSNLILNFCKPDSPIINKKAVSMVILPGESGEYGVTVGHSPIISQLKPGVVTVVHLSGESEKFFVPGGFAISNADSVTDVSVPEAYALSDFDDATIKAGYAEAVRVASTSAEGSVAKATAQIEVDVYSSLARAVGITL